MTINLLNCIRSIFLFIGCLDISTLTYADSLCNEKIVAERIQHFMKANHIDGAAVLLAKQGKIKTCLFGEAVPARHVPVSENTIFELGSITKTFTGLILAQRSLSGKTQLSEAIEYDLNPRLSSAHKKITYLDLATYTSGLPFNAKSLAYNASGSLKNKITLDKDLKEATLPFLPGSHMLYSNLGFGILGQIFAKKEQISLPEIMMHYILSPLKMNSSGLDISHTDKHYLAQGYNAEGKPVPYLTSGLFGGSWAMRVSTKDMRTYLKVVLGDEKFIYKKIHQAIQLSQSAYYDMPRGQ